MKRPTQVDVARSARVLRATVSYVLNEQTDQRIPISPDTRRRVLDAIAALRLRGLMPALSRSVAATTKTIGVLLPLVRNSPGKILRGISS